MGDSPFVEGTKEIISIMEKLKNKEFSGDDEKQALLDRLSVLDEFVGEKLNAAMIIAEL